MLLAASSSSGAPIMAASVSAPAHPSAAADAAALRRCCRVCGREGRHCVDVFGEEGRRRQLLPKIRFCFSAQVSTNGSDAVNASSPLPLIPIS